MTLNENFKTKLEELEAARDAVDKTDIEAKLDELRREKDGLGKRSFHIQHLHLTRCLVVYQTRVR